MNKDEQVKNRRIARELAYEYLDREDPLGWFDKLYEAADNDLSALPWAKSIPNPHLTSWVNSKKIDGQGMRALVIGCGLGDNAEFLARAGFDVTAFDLSRKAIGWCRSRFPASSVNYRVIDLFGSPPEWAMTFDFVLEVYTLQALPQNLRLTAIPKIAKLVAADGTLLLITRARGEHEDPGALPWPLTRQDVDIF